MLLAGVLAVDTDDEVAGPRIEGVKYVEHVQDFEAAELTPQTVR